MIRQLKPSEPWPSGKPRRYKNTQGYTRLRWKIGQGEYVETYERDEAGLLVRDKPPKAIRIDAAEAVRLYAMGKSTVEVGEIMGHDPAAIWRVLRRNGIKTRSVADYSVPLDENEVVRLYVEERMNVTDIHRRLGVDVQRIRRVLRAAHVMRKPGSPGKSKRGVTYDTEYKRARKAVMERSKGLCEIRVSARCARKASHVHHRKIRSQQGTNELSNLAACCASCHLMVHGNPAKSYEEGWLVPSWANPADVPLRPAA